MIKFSFVIYGCRSTGEYRVERIVGKKKSDGKVFYRIKWLGYPDEENTWEPFDNCQRAKPLIDEFEANLKRDRRKCSNCKCVVKKPKIKIYPTRRATISAETNIAEISEQYEQLCIRNVRDAPLDTSSMNVSITDAENLEKKKELLECSSSQIEILGALPCDRGPMTLGVRIKGKVEDEDICYFDSKEVAMLWPYLYIAYLESRIIFR